MYLRKYILFFLSALAFVACDTIDESERWLEAPALTGEQHPVLIEEYTGQQCINCPEAAEELHKIIKQSGVPHIIVAMHSPSSGYSLPKLAAKDAGVYASEFNHIALPEIMINRRKLPTGLFFNENRGAWGGLIRQISSQVVPYSLEAKAQFNEEKKEIELSVNSALIAGEGTPNLGLQLWLVEDVKAPQITHEGWVNDYQHHNVFRLALNSTWGEAYSVGTAYKKSFSLPSNLEDIQNAKVVAFLFDTKTKAIFVSQLVSVE